MGLRAWRFITPLLAALALTMESAHVLELPQKMQYDTQMYSAVNTTGVSRDTEGAAAGSRSGRTHTSVSKERRYTAEAGAKLVLWLFVINLGIAFGAGLYESRIVVPQWLSLSPESGYHWNAAAARQANTGLRFWVYVTTVPLTLLTFVSLVVAWWTQHAVSRAHPLPVLGTS